MAIKRIALGHGAVDDGAADLKWEADAVIVGGAVAGASMTHALAEYGISSVLLERNPKVPEINRGDVLQPLTLQFLDRWGVYEHVERMGGFPLYEWNFFNPRIGHLATWNFSSLPCKFNHQTILRHVKIHEALYAAMGAKQNLINPQWAASVTGVLIDDAADAVVGVVGKQGERSFEARGRLVIAADGPRSKLREFLGIEQEERYRYDHEYLMLTTPRPAVPEMDQKGMQYVGRHGLVVLIPLDGGDEVRIPVQIPLGTQPEWRRLSADELRHRLILRAPVLEGVDTKVAMDKLSHSYPVHWKHSRAYVKNHVCLIGEAARTVHPTTAQGMNMAMLDAEVLAAVVKRCLVKDGISDDALRLYERSRLPIAETVMETSHHQTLHHTACGVWHDIWGSRNYRWSEDEEMKRDISMSIAGLKNPTSRDLRILEDAGVAA
jgi:2-polyprenyl-6-methoxyphenol hydroxylase-like FAD-dependent oxidoreductase